jgi:hypothetical protein
MAHWEKSETLPPGLAKSGKLMDASGLGPRTLPDACALDTANPDLQTY